MFSTMCYMFIRNFGENQVNKRVSGLHCMWLVPCTRASSNDGDEFLTLRMDPLKEGRSTWRAWPNRYLRGHRIMLCVGTPVLTSDIGVRLFVIERSYGVWLVLTTRCRNLVPMTSLCYGIQTLSVEPYCCITCSFEFGCGNFANVS
ncbi:hypothetical protein M9H77_03925 [Catharanthus roseus]|uniref:Uncharacterized protein n=1 Tax=Catharanthus roseus TaxID=4058 RepID=A0ACC0CCV2_CATRO|nr:hypothetical protein M9H77_03925 [Catharanthus roseus]